MSEHNARHYAFQFGKEWLRHVPDLPKNGEAVWLVQESGEHRSVEGTWDIAESLYNLAVDGHCSLNMIEAAAMLGYTIVIGETMDECRVTFSRPGWFNELP